MDLNEQTGTSPMNTRRNFLSALAGLPFMGWLKPVEAASVEPASISWCPASPHSFTVSQHCSIRVTLRYGYVYWEPMYAGETFCTPVGAIDVTVFAR